jgi:ribosome-interacting GTPase 1
VPANLPPQYYAAKRRFEAAKDIEEKIEILKEMQAIMPKHKGTDKLRGELSSRLANLRKEAQRSPAKRRKHDHYKIAKQGAAQIALIGAPNVGKSTIIAGLTNADTQVASYPFTTAKPVIGMMPFEDISIQLIDTPPISDDFMDKLLPELLRRVDFILLIADIGTDDALDQVEAVVAKLDESRIRLTVDKAQDEDGEYIYKETLMIANKEDLEGSHERLDILEEFYSQSFPIVPISAKKENGLEPLRKEIYDALGIIRVYTKSIGRKADLTDPIILERGSTVMEAAAEIHKEFFEGLKFARIWGDGQNIYDGQRVSRDHPLEDGNILEFHISD